MPIFPRELIRFWCADLLCRDTWPMLRAILVRSIVVFFGGGILVHAQPPPPLEGPDADQAPPVASAPPAAQSGPRSETTPTPTPTPSPAARAATPRPRRGSMLVIPGVTAPAPRPGSVGRPRFPQPLRPPLNDTSAPDGVSPPLSGPSNAGSPFQPSAPTEGPEASETPSLPAIPLTLEPLDDASAPAPNRPGARAPRETPRRSQGRPVRGEDPDTPAASPRPAPWRMPGLLGRILGQPPATSSRDAAQGQGPGAANRADAPTEAEPETDAVVKRRIEQQIRATLGDKVHSVQVRVSGRNVRINARAARFWQKRGVSRALESLPALAGFRARIDLDN